MSESNNGAVIKFGASLSKEQLNQIIANAKEVAKRKYDIVFNPTIDDQNNIEKFVKEYRNKIEVLKSETNKTLNEFDFSKIDSASAVNQINNLVSSLKVLQSVENFSYNNNTNGIDSYTKLFDMTHIKLDTGKISELKKIGLNFTDVQSLITSLETLVSRTKVSSSTAIEEFSKDGTSVSNALSMYAEAVKNANAKAGEEIASSGLTLEETLTNQVNALAILLNNVNNYKDIYGSKATSKGFKGYLERIYGNSSEIDEFFNNNNALINSGMKKFKETIDKNYSTLLGKAQTNGISLAVESINNSLNGAFNTNIDNSKVLQRIKDGNLQYKLEVDATGVKTVLEAIQQADERLSTISKRSTDIKISVNKTALENIDKLNGSLLLLDNYLANIQSKSKIAIEIQNDKLSTKTLSEQLGSISRMDMPKVKLTTNADSIETQINEAIKRIRENIQSNPLNVNLNGSNINATVDYSKIVDELNKLDFQIKFNGFNEETLRNTLNEVQKYVDSQKVNLNFGYDSESKSLTALKDTLKTKLNKVKVSVAVGNFTYNSALKEFRAKLKDADVPLGVTLKVSNQKIKELKTLINEQLNDKITLKLKSIRATQAIKDLKDKISNLKISVKIKPLTKKEITENVIGKLNDKSNPLTIKIGAFEATGAIENLKTAIEEALEKVGLTVNIKTTQTTQSKESKESINNSENLKSQLGYIREITKAYSNRNKQLLQSTTTDKTFEERLASENKVITEQTALLSQNGKIYLEYIKTLMNGGNSSSIAEKYGLNEQTIAQLNSMYQQYYNIPSTRNYGNTIDANTNQNSKNLDTYNNNTLKEQLSIITKITTALANKTKLELQASATGKIVENELNSENTIIREQSALLDETGKKYLEYIQAKLQNNTQKATNIAETYGFSDETITKLEKAYQKGYENSTRNYGKISDNTINQNVAQLETYQKELSKLSGNLTTIEEKFNSLGGNSLGTGLTNNINTIKTSLESLEETYTNLVNNPTNINTENLNAFKSNIDNVSKSVSELSTKINAIPKIEDKVSGLNSQITTKLSNESSALENFKLLDSLKEIQTNLNNIDKSNPEKAIARYEELNKEFESITSQLKTLQKYESQLNGTTLTNNNITDLINKLSINESSKNATVQSNTTVSGDNYVGKTYIEVLNAEQQKLNESTTEFKTILDNIKNGNDTFESQSEQLQKLSNTIMTCTENFKILSNESKSALSSINSTTSQNKIDNAYSKLIADITQFQAQNGRAMSSNYTFKSQLDSIISEANSIDRTKENLMGLQSRFESVRTEVTKLGKTGKSVGQELDNLFSKIGLKAILGTMIYRVIGYFKEMLTTVEEVDTSMVTLKRVTSETSDTYDKFLTTATSSAKELASTVTDVIDAVSSFSRLGYNLDEATTLGNIATMYSNVGFIDIDTATSDLVTAMKAFNIEAEDSVSIVDAFNDVGNKFALSSSDIGEGLTQSASALAVAGNSLNESIAMITGGTEITQDANSMGNALKTLSMRLRSSKVEVEEMGEDTEGMAETTSKMREDIKALSGVDIMKDANTYKSTYEIMREIANVWNNLSDINQAGLLEKIAGKNRANSIYPYVQKCA